MAAYAIQFRRGTTTEHSSFTGLLGEVTVDTTKKTIVVHDGSTAGGQPLALEGAAVSSTTGTFSSNVTVGGTLAVTSTTTMGGDLTMTGHILPSANITYDLGSATKMWKDVYIGPGSLYINGKKVIEDDSGSINITTDNNEDLKLTTSGTGTLKFISGNGINFTGELGAVSGDLQIGDHIDMNSSLIKELATPVSSTDAANKAYVDSTSASAVTGGANAGSFTTVTTSGNATIGGNLTVNGTTTTINSNVLDIGDNIIELNSDATGTPTQNAGIDVQRGDATSKQLLWNETTDKWSVDTETFVAGTFEGDLTGDVTGNVIGNVDGIVGGNTPAAASVTTLNASSTITGNVTGNLTGDVTGDVTGDLTGDVTGDLTGNVLSSGTSTFASVDINGGAIDGAAIGGTTPAAGSFTSLGGTTITASTNFAGDLVGDVTGDVTGTVSSISNHMIDEDNMATDSATKVPSQQSVKAYVASQIATKDNTDEMTEGSTNLYFTNARARGAISVSGDISYNSSTGVISTTGLASSDTDDLSEGSANLYYTDARADARIAAASTTDLSEGTNLYYTDARADARIANATTSDLTEGTNQYYTDARARAAISASGSLSYNSTTGAMSYTERTDEELQDLVGAMLSSNTETGITVSYQDGDGTIDLVVNTTHFHSSVQTVTSSQETTNASSTVSFTFSELSNAQHYAVFLNRQLLRPAEYSVSGTSVVIATGVIAEDDELEVTGFTNT